MFLGADLPTLNSLGIKEKLAERNLEIIDPYGTQDPAESIERRRQGLLYGLFPDEHQCGDD